MITSIKNLTNKKLTFDSLEVKEAGELALNWTKTNITYEVYASLVNAYLSDKIDFLNKNGKTIKKLRKKSFYVLEKNNGKLKKMKKTKEVDIALNKLNNQFTEMMNSYLD